MIRTYACPDDCGRHCRVQVDIGDLGGAPIPCLLMGRGEMYGWLPVEATGGDPVLAWLEHEAALARHVLEAEQDPGNIEIIRHWVYIHDCLVRQRREELDAPAVRTGGDQ